MKHRQPELERIHEKVRKSRTCAKPFNVVPMFKILALQNKRYQTGRSQKSEPESSRRNWSAT
ncbi:MAG: hypothetical protein PHO08_07495 [Methylococcales bacterium]|nr:hypothetical protein [Methylococcales bacterium]MDD5630442.1 hypothetical protein [Methylococcales bacterium]